MLHSKLISWVALIESKLGNIFLFHFMDFSLKNIQAKY